MKHLLLPFILLFTALFCSGQPGLPDTTFNPTDTGFSNGDGANGAVRTIAVQSDGRIFIGGDFTAYSGTPLNRIAQLNEDGSCTSVFNGNTTKANSTVYTLAVQRDGKVVVGGEFTDFNSNWYHDYMTRLDGDGTLDAYFNNGSGVNGTPGGANGPVHTLAVQADGKILIGGWFNYYNNVPRNYIARLGKEGQLDPSFDAGTTLPGGVTAMALQADDKIVIAGSHTDMNGVSRYYLRRLNTNGSPDATFNTGSGVNGIVTSLAITSDGKILIAGSFTSYDGTARNRIARLHTNGNLDASFNPNTGADGTIHALAVQGDGKILIGGDFSAYRGTARNRIARLNTNGNLDATFNPGTGADKSIYSLALTADGRMLIGGSFTAYDGTSRNRVARLLPDGSLDATFNRGTGARGPVFSLSLPSNGKIIIGGGFTTYNGIVRNYIAQLNSDGILDASFDPGSGADSAVLATTIQPDGKILAAGAFTLFNSVARNRITRLNRDGSLDGSFNPGGGANNSIYSVVLQSDGKILIGGAFTSYNNTIRFRMARLNPDGSLDASFNPGGGPNGTVNTISPQPDGKILIGGYFTAYNGVTRNYLARLHSDGTLDASFNSNSGANNPVLSMVQQPGGKILIGGSFTYYHGTARNRIARLHPDGTLDASFNPGNVASGSVSALAVQSDGRVLAGGNGTFSNNSNYWSHGIARLNPDGSLDLSFNSQGGGANNTICAIALQADGRILVGGHFTAYNGLGRNRTARLQGGANDIIVGSISPLSYCAGTEMSVPFTASGVFDPANNFIARLSDPWGSFAPTASTSIIGRLKTAASGSIRATLPHNLPEGTAYRVRVESYLPYVVSPDNGYNLTVYATPATPFIDVPADTSFCAGSSIKLAASATTGVQWYRDSVAIDGATGHTYEIRQAGRYSVTTTQNNCPSAMSGVVVVTARPLPAKPVISQDGNLLSVAATTGLQWYKDGLPISGATTSRYTAAATGQYSVQVTQNGCSAHSDAVNVVLTAIVDPSTWNDAVTVYPVPVQDVLHFTNRGARQLRVQVLDVAGKVVRTVLLSASPASLRVNDLAPGTYLLLITDIRKGETIARPIVKQ